MRTYIAIVIFVLLLPSCKKENTATNKSIMTATLNGRVFNANKVTYIDHIDGALGFQGLTVTGIDDTTRDTIIIELLRRTDTTYYIGMGYDSSAGYYLNGSSNNKFISGTVTLTGTNPYSGLFNVTASDATKIANGYFKIQ